MNESKPWYASSGIWGGILAAAAPAIGLVFHMTVSSADTAQLADALAAIGAGIGGLVAVYGRVKATKQITASK